MHLGTGSHWFAIKRVKPSPPTPFQALSTRPKLTPAHHLWLPPSQILNTRLAIRSGGSFVWLPPLPLPSIRRVVFIAGGVGINPLISMLSVIVEQRAREGKLGFEVRFLYSVRESFGGDGKGEEILFLERLRGLIEGLEEEGGLVVFVTGGDGDGGGEVGVVGTEGLNVQRRRIRERDLEDALGDMGERIGTVDCVCGVPGMTARFVELAGKAEGMDEKRVLSEKWW